MDPSITSITFDKDGYVAGDTITATVNYVAGKSVTSDTQTFTGTATDAVTHAKGTLVVNFIVNQESPNATTVDVSDSGNRSWTQVSDNGSVAVFTAVA